MIDQAYLCRLINKILTTYKSYKFSVAAWNIFFLIWWDVKLFDIWCKLLIYTGHIYTVCKVYIKSMVHKCNTAIGLILELSAPRLKIADGSKDTNL